MENTEKLIFEVSLKIINPENPEKNFEAGVRFGNVEDSKHFTRSQFSEFIQKEISTHFAIAVAECENIPLDVKMAFAEIDNQTAPTE